MEELLTKLEDFIGSHDGINDKSRLTELVVEKFNLTKDRSVFYNNLFAIWFSQAMSSGFSNTVLALSNLQKFDSKPFIVCVVCPDRNYLLISNSTFLKKISHSSQELSVTNIKESFNGSNILRTFNLIENIPKNFYRLFLIHDSIGFGENLTRLVEATNAIVGTGHPFDISPAQLTTILNSPLRAERFCRSTEFGELKSDLDQRVATHRHAILVASLIQNVNVRGRVIEYLVAGEDEALREELIQALLNNQHGIPRFSTENSLGDYTKIFQSYHTETDVKTKVMALDSNPKAYNIDKMLEFLSAPQSVFMFYFIGIDPGRIFNTTLVSMFDRRILSGTLLLKHWAGRNSRGVTQLEGRSVRDSITNPGNHIEFDGSAKFLHSMIEA